jgi:ribosomal protein S27E
MFYLLIIALLVGIIYILVSKEKEKKRREEQDKAGMCVWGSGASAKGDKFLTIKCNYCNNHDIVVPEEALFATCSKCGNTQDMQDIKGS